MESAGKIIGKGDEEAFIFHADLTTSDVKNEIAALDTYKPYFADWNLPNDKLYNLITLICDLTSDIDSADAEISVDYDPIFEDAEIDLKRKGRLLKTYTSRTEVELDGIDDIYSLRSNASSEVKVPIVAKTFVDYSCGRLGLHYEKRASQTITMSREALAAIKTISKETGISGSELKKFIIKKAKKEDQHYFEVKSRRGLVDLKIEIDGHEMPIERGNREWEFMNAIMTCSNNLRRKADVGDVYEKLYGSDYEVPKNDVDGRARKSKNMDDLYQRFYRINKKVRADAKLDIDFIIKEGEKYCVNPVLTRL